MAYDFESSATIVVLLVLISIYLYILISPGQPHVPEHTRNFVIPADTLENFQAFVKGKNDWKFTDDIGSSGLPGNYTPPKQNWGNGQDDFFLFEEGSLDQIGQNSQQDIDLEPIVPSTNFHCGKDWVLLRSQVNYKFLWMHTANMWMAAGATIDTPMHHKSFQLYPVNEDCSDGWVLLKEGDSNGFIYMVPPDATAEEGFQDEWVVKIGTSDEKSAQNNTVYHFLLENDGYLLNRRSMAFINVIANSEYVVRGHSSSYSNNYDIWNTNTNNIPKLPARREYSSALQFEYINSTIVQIAINKEEYEEKDSIIQDQKLLIEILNYPKSIEKRVISFGLYGSNPKYTKGAIRNVEMAKIYFPDWICRFYVTTDVPKDVIITLQNMGSEIYNIPSGKGYISGMFWRFMVASDSTVDRYIIRDSDSRMNARDRIAVEEWIESKYDIHIMRDHVNHCLVMNGGMWGGVKNAIPDMAERIEVWESRDQYAADLNFLEQKIWPDIKDRQIAHDSYCCDRFPNARPFPSKRPMTYQHVGQVFDAEDHPRLNDIDGFIRGVPVPGSCRKHADWIYG